jgi:CIC family chloride channel protein
LIVGVMGWFVPQVMGVGYKYVGDVLNGDMALKMMVLLLAMKLVAVATSYASGNAGGIFGPSLFLGAMLGGIVGSAAHHAFPGHTATPGAYALVGMGTTFAGVIRAPMTSVVMIFEITRDYAVIVPLMISNLVSYFIASRLQREPIYEVLAQQEGIHLPRAARAAGERPRVSEVMRAATEVLDAKMRASDALERVGMSGFQAWPVADESGVVGVVSLEQLKQLADDRERAPKTLGSVVGGGEFPHVHADHRLDAALERMGSTHLDVLPVVGRANVRQLEGVVTLADVLASYGVGPKPE